MAAPQPNRPAANPADPAARQESIVEILWRRKELVLIVFGLCVISAAVLLRMTPKRLTVESRVLVTRNLPANADKNAVDLPTFLNTQAELIRSATVLSLAMGGPGMETMSLFAGSDNPINTLKERLEVEPMHQTSLIAIRLADTNPDEAMQIVDVVMKAYVDQVRNQKRNSAAPDFDRIGQERAKLDADRTDFKQLLYALKAETGGMTPGDSTVTLAVQKLQQLSQSLTKVQMEGVELKSQFDDALKTVGMTADNIDQDRLATSTVVGPESLPLLRSNLAALSQQLIEAKRQFVPSHPAVRTIQAQIKDLQLSQAATLQSLIASAANREKNARELYVSQERITQNLNKKAAEIAVTTDHVKDLDQRVAAKDAELQKLTVVESVGVEAKVVDDVAVVPNSAVPDAKKTLALAALIGLALGMMTALVREWISPSLGAVHRIADTVGIPLLGTLPRVTGHSPAELAKLTFDTADGDAAEAFRSVRTSLLFGAEHCQTIAITSPATGDGKTTLACNLAILLAQSGKRVALVDADVRQPALEEVFGLTNGIGLSGLLNGDEVDAAVCRTEIEHLDVIPAGPRSADISQQLNSPRFNEVLRDLKGRYDHILFDTGGVIGSNDARVIAAGCDTTVLVMRDERTTRFAATTARDALLSVGAMLMGIVLNDAARTGPAYPPGVERREPAAGLTPGAGSRLRSRR